MHAQLELNSTRAPAPSKISHSLARRASLSHSRRGALWQALFPSSPEVFDGTIRIEGILLHPEGWAGERGGRAAKEVFLVVRDCVHTDLSCLRNVNKAILRAVLLNCRTDFVSENSSRVLYRFDELPPRLAALSGVQQWRERDVASDAGLVSCSQLSSLKKLKLFVIRVQKVADKHVSGLDNEKWLNADLVQQRREEYRAVNTVRLLFRSSPRKHPSREDSHRCWSPSL